MAVVCPKCRQNAPLVYRGVNAFCTACGAPRMPLAASSVNLAGQPSKVTGAVARVFGWIVLGGGWFLAATAAFLLSLAFGAGAMAPWLVAAPFAIVGTILAWVLLRSGRELKVSGVATEKATRSQAVFALAKARGGVLTAPDLAGAINVPLEEGDAILTSMAKEHPDQVAVDIDDDGRVLYRFPAIHWQVPQPPTRVAEHVRVGEPAPPPAADRVDDYADEALPARQKVR